MNRMDKKTSILSVYLSSSGKQVPYPSFYISQFHSLIHQNLKDIEQKEWQSDSARIEEYLHESINKSSARSLVFFTAGKDLWQVLDFEFYLPPLVKTSSQPYLKPIEDAVKKYSKYLVLLVDRKKARLFTVNLGKIEEEKLVFDGEVPQNVKAKKIDWGRDDKIFRHIEDHLHRHLQTIAKKTFDFFMGKDIHFLIIGGHAEMIPKIKKHLPYPLNQMILGQFITELNIPLNDVLLHSKRVASKVDEKLAKLL